MSDKKIDRKLIENAFGPDRLLIIGLIRFLIGKGIIESQKDLELLKEMTISIAESMNSTGTPAIKAQIQKTKPEIIHLLNSFNLDNR